MVLPGVSRWQPGGAPASPGPGAGVWLAKLLVDGTVAVAAGDPGARSQGVLLVTAAWVGVTLLSAAGSPLTSAWQGLLTDRVTARVNLLLMNKANRLPDLGYFETPRFYDELRMVQQEASFRPLQLLDGLGNWVRSLVVGVAMLALLGRFHPLIPLVLVLTWVAPAYVSFRLAQNAFAAAEWGSPAAREMVYYSSVLLSEVHAKEVRIFDLGAFFMDRYRNVFAGLHGRLRRVRLTQARWAVALIAVGALGGGAAFLWVVSGALRGRFTAGDLLLFTSAGVQAQQSLSAVVSLATLIYESMLYMQKLFNFLDARPALAPVPPGGGAPVPVPLVTGLEVRDVTFRYPDGHPVLAGVSFRIRAGETVALVGENGAGKTTLVKLLCRLYDPQAGQILVDGVDLRDCDLDAWRRQVAVVFQDYGRYHLTARENIGLGAVAAMADQDRIAAAAVRAGAAPMIAGLPQGYDTMLGKQFAGGVDLSGGEWQKVALARAFVRAAQVLIPDEPTAALDARAEYDVYEQFAQLTRGKTTLLISHRFSTVRMADRIVVLGDGRVLEEGTHDELLARSGRYAELYRMQAERYQ